MNGEKMMIGAAETRAGKTTDSSIDELILLTTKKFIPVPVRKPWK